MSEENPYRMVTPGEARKMGIRKAEFLNALADERARQDQKWGCNVVDPDRMVVVLLEEVGEIARALLERDKVGLDKELVQTAAVCSKLFELLAIPQVDELAFRSRSNATLDESKAAKTVFDREIARGGR